jgi:hypothetical protein
MFSDRLLGQGQADRFSLLVFEEKCFYKLAACLPAGIIGLGCKRDCLAQVLFFNLHLSIFLIKCGTQTAKFHNFLNKNNIKLRNRKKGFFLINVIAPYNHFTD